MKKETEVKEVKKNNKVVAYIVIALAIVGIVAFNSTNKPETKVETTTAKATSEVAEEKPIVEVENTVARIDILTKPYTEEPNFEVYIGDSKTPANEATSMPMRGFRGYVIQKEGSENTLIIKALKDADIMINLRGKWELKNPENKEEGLKENWVDFTSVAINDEEILPETIAVWHNKPFRHVINAKAGETYNVVAKWTKHTETIKAE